MEMGSRGLNEDFGPGFDFLTAAVQSYNVVAPPGGVGRIVGIHFENPARFMVAGGVRRQPAVAAQPDGHPAVRPVSRSRLTSHCGGRGASEWRAMFLGEA